MRLRKSLIGIGFLVAPSLLALSSTGNALAQDEKAAQPKPPPRPGPTTPQSTVPDASRAQAETLFESAKTLMDQGDTAKAAGNKDAAMTAYTKACPMFAESQRLDP